MQYKSRKQIEEILDGPLSNWDVDWKPFDTKTDWIQYAPYIDARAVRRLLDAAFTRWGWSQTYKEVAGGFICTITVDTMVASETGVGGERLQITKSDAANLESIEPLKSGASAALKRAAVGFGIGADLYNYPRISVEKKNRKGEPVDNSKMYMVLEWAMPHLDSLVLAWGKGWRPRSDRVWLKPGQNPEWHGYEGVKAPVRDPEPPSGETPKQTVDNVAHVTSGAQDKATATDRKPTKKETALFMQEWQELGDKLNTTMSTQDFNDTYALIAQKDNVPADKKNEFFGRLSGRAKWWGVVWDKENKTFHAYKAEPDTEEARLVLREWKEAMGKVTMADQAQNYLDSFVSSDVIRAWMMQPFIEYLESLEMSVDIQHGNVVVLAF